MESLYKRKMFASMRKTKVDASKKRQIGLPASILDDSDEGSFSSSSSGSQSDFQSSPEEDSAQEDRGRSESGATSSDDSRSVTRRKRSFLGGDDSSSSSSRGEEDDDDEEGNDRSQPKRIVQPKKRSRLQPQDESDSDHTEEKRKEEAEKAKRRQRHNKLLALSRRMKARVPNRRRSRLKQVHLCIPIDSMAPRFDTEVYQLMKNCNFRVPVMTTNLKKPRMKLVVTEKKKKTTARKKEVMEGKRRRRRKKRRKKRRRKKRRSSEPSENDSQLLLCTVFLFLHLKGKRKNLTYKDFIVAVDTYSGDIYQKDRKRVSLNSCNMFFGAASG